VRRRSETLDRAKSEKLFRAKSEKLYMAKFALVGGLNTGVDFAVFMGLLYGLGWPIGWSQAIAYGCGTLNSYLINRSWTFRAQGRAKGSEILKFVLLNAGSFVAATGVLLLLQQAGWLPPVAKAVSVAASLAVNYAGSRFWVFRSKSGAETST
jgi:putative flippase GtrA